MPSTYISIDGKIKYIGTQKNLMNTVCRSKCALGSAATQGSEKVTARLMLLGVSDTP